MLLDARALPDNFEVSADYCVLGAGAAGIAIARELGHAGKSVLLVEGGGLEYDKDSQDLYRGDSTGERYFPLQSCRMRFFGGSTSVWGGWCRPLDEVDFKMRPWVPMSGWPFQRDELEPYFRRSQEILDLGPYELEPGYWKNEQAGRVPLQLPGDSVLTRTVLISPPTMFGRKFRDELLRVGNVRLVTHANGSEIRLGDDGRVNQIHLRCLNGKQGKATAHYFVLACGGIENARLLLLSDKQAASGLGNERGFVGRYFMEHLMAPTGFFRTDRPSLFKFYERILFESVASGYFATTEHHQTENQTLNLSFSVVEKDPNDMRLLPHLTGYTEDPAELLETWAQWEEDYRRGQQDTKASFALRAGLGAASPQKQGSLHNFTVVAVGEQAPNPESRITLGPERDALGLRRTKLHWQLTPLEKRTFRRGTLALGDAFKRAGIGDVRLADWLTEEDALFPDCLAPEWHHIGTTRMSVDASSGVVNPSCQLHGVSNLYLAGSSVFPTSGSANPTHTLVALALRLADHLKTQRT